MMVKWLWLSVVIVVLDQISKQFAENSLVLYEAVPILPSFNLMLAYNTGAAFSFLAGAGGWHRWFFLVLALAISLFLLLWLIRLERDQKRQAVALALILGGAVGNVIDRALFGHVIDFIDLYHTAFAAWPGFTSDGHWPAFNIADMAITTGVILLIIDSLFGAHSVSSKQASNKVS
jgi:signal peptidase II